MIPLSRRCCRTLDSVRRREIKEATGEGGEERGEREKGGGRREKRKWKEEKREISYLEISAPAARPNVPRVMYALPANALLFLCALVFAEDYYPRYTIAARPRVLGTVYFRFHVAFVPRAAPPSLNQLVCDRANLRTVISLEKKEEKGEIRETRRIRKTREVLCFGHWNLLRTTSGAWFLDDTSFCLANLVKLKRSSGEI